MFLKMRYVAFLLSFSVLVTSFVPCLQAARGKKNNNNKCVPKKPRSEKVLNPIVGLAASTVCAMIALLLKYSDKKLKNSETFSSDWILPIGMSVTTSLAMLTSLAFSAGSLISAVRLVLQQAAPKKI